MPHTLRLTRTVLLLAVAMLTLAGCGESGSGAPGSPSSASPAATDSAASPGSPAPAGAATSLDVELMPDGKTVTDTWTLECDGAAPVGDSGAPDPAAACTALAERGTALMAEPGPDVACTMQYGGPQRATVTGTVDGESIDAVFANTDGCQISRWDALSGLLGAAGMQ